MGHDDNDDDDDDDNDGKGGLLPLAVVMVTHPQSNVTQCGHSVRRRGCCT